MEPVCYLGVGGVQNSYIYAVASPLTNAYTNIIHQSVYVIA